MEGHEDDVLRGAHRLLERHCADFILIKIRRKVEGTGQNELLTRLKSLSELNYVACTLAKDGVLIQHKSVTSAMDTQLSIVLVAQDPYRHEA